MTVNLKAAEWINPPSQYEISENAVKLTTDPNTDLWQRSYYGFRNDNAPALLLKSGENFTFTVKVSFDYRERYDQCGVMIYIDSENWFKASIEYETDHFSRLGSVVTNCGYSDWATADISTVNEIWSTAVKVPKRFVSPSTSIIGSDIKKNHENAKVDRLVPKPMGRAVTTRWGQPVPPFLCSCFPDLFVALLISHSESKRLPPFQRVNDRRRWANESSRRILV